MAGDTRHAALVERVPGARDVLRGGGGRTDRPARWAATTRGEPRSMRLRLLTFLIAAAGAAPLAADAQDRTAATPNVVLILADDLGWGDVGAMNPESGIPTPHIDRLAGEGMRFVDAHAPAAVCTPTRYALLTGRYTWRTRLTSGVLGGYSPPLLAPDRPTLGTLLQAHGYRTAAVGKWHLGMAMPFLDPAAARTEPWEGDPGIDFAGTIADSPIHHGFDEYFGVSASLDMAPYVYIRDDRFTALPTGEQPAVPFPHFIRRGPRADDFVVDDVLDRLVDGGRGVHRPLGAGRGALLPLPAADRAPQADPASPALPRADGSRRVRRFRGADRRRRGGGPRGPRPEPRARRDAGDLHLGQRLVHVPPRRRGARPRRRPVGAGLPRGPSPVERGLAGNQGGRLGGRPPGAVRGAVAGRRRGGVGDRGHRRPHRPLRDAGRHPGDRTGTGCGRGQRVDAADAARRGGDAGRPRRPPLVGRHVRDSRRPVEARDRQRLGRPPERRAASRSPGPICSSTCRATPARRATWRRTTPRSSKRLEATFERLRREGRSAPR